MLFDDVLQCAIPTFFFSFSMFFILVIFRMDKNHSKLQILTQKTYERYSTGIIFRMDKNHSKLEILNLKLLTEKYRSLLKLSFASTLNWNLKILPILCATFGPLVSASLETWTLNDLCRMRQNDKKNHETKSELIILIVY